MQFENKKDVQFPSETEGIIISDMGGRDPQKVDLNYDEVMEYIGQFGRFQRKIFLWLSLVSGAAGLAVVVFAFTAFTPSYRCLRYFIDMTSAFYRVPEPAVNVIGAL